VVKLILELEACSWSCHGMASGLSEQILEFLLVFGCLGPFLISQNLQLIHHCLLQRWIQLNSSDVVFPSLLKIPNEAVAFGKTKESLRVF